MTMMATNDLGKRMADALRMWATDRPMADDRGDVCQECDGTGWQQVEGGVVKCRVCLSRTRGQAPGIPLEEHGAMLDGFQVTRDNGEAVRHAKLFLDGVHPDIYFTGSVGTGKTTLACRLLNELWAKGQRVEFFRVPKLLVSLLPGADDLDGIIERIVAVPVICLDDVGASQASDFARRMLQVIYDARGDKGTRTIWTSNLDMRELATFNAGDDRLTSRIAGRAKVVELAGPDWRLKKAKQLARERR